MRFDRSAADAISSSRERKAFAIKSGPTAWMGLPIAGDSLYGGVESKRLFLEAFSVTLYDGAWATAEWKLYNGN
jgi:hypothetical protein